MSKREKLDIALLEDIVLLIGGTVTSRSETQLLKDWLKALGG